MGFYGKLFQETAVEPVEKTPVDIEVGFDEASTGVVGGELSLQGVIAVGAFAECGELRGRMSDPKSVRAHVREGSSRNRPRLVEQRLIWRRTFGSRRLQTWSCQLSMSCSSSAGPGCGDGLPKLAISSVAAQQAKRRVVWSSSARVASRTKTRVPSFTALMLAIMAAGDSLITVSWIAVRLN